MFGHHNSVIRARQPRRVRPEYWSEAYEAIVQRRERAERRARLNYVDPVVARWVQDTALATARKGYVVIPSRDCVPTLKWGNVLESVPLAHPAWKRANMVSIILGDLALVDYDGNKPEGCGSDVTRRALLRSLALPCNTPTQQENAAGTSAHWLFRLPVNAYRKTKLHGNDLLVGNALMHLKPGKQLNLPHVRQLPVAPKTLQAFLTCPGDTSKDVWLAIPGNDPLVAFKGGRLSLSADGAIADACRRISSAPHGERNQTLNNEALGPLKFVSGGVLELDAVMSSLTEAALVCGLASAEIRQTLASAWQCARREPRGSTGSRIVKISGVNA
ncbi:hypothetical protein ACS5VF_000937 [Enterobacter hormaechei]